MNDIEKFINNNYNFKDYHDLLLRIANYKITGNPNDHYIRKIFVTHFPPGVAMAADTEHMEIMISTLVLQTLLNTPEERLLFLTSFFHECAHIIQYKTYMEETDPVKEFHLFLKFYSATYLCEEDHLLHNYFYPEYDAHCFALNYLKQCLLSQDMINNVTKRYQEIFMNHTVYNKDRFVEYPINGKMEVLTMEQLELYKALFTYKSNAPKVPVLFSELVDKEHFHTMSENLQLLKKEQQKKEFNPNLAQVILYVEANKLCSRTDLLNDILTLLREYMVPTEPNISFYTQLLINKTNLLLRIQNNIEERRIIWNYLEQLKSYYYNSGQYAFYSYYLEPYVECLHKVPLVKKMI